MFRKILEKHDVKGIANHEESKPITKLLYRYQSGGVGGSFLLMQDFLLQISVLILKLRALKSFAGANSLLDRGGLKLILCTHPRNNRLPHKPLL